MAFSLHFAASSDIGLGRYKNNQDSGYAGPHLLVVADGMGGAAGGDVASSTVIGELVPLDTEVPGPDASRDVVQAIMNANSAMAEQVQADSSLQGMGSTVTAMLRTGHQLVIAHVGDSRAYCLDDGALEQLTHDHTFVQRLIDTGQITEDEAERHPQRSVILRVVGHMEGGEVDIQIITPRIGQRLLLCSDGLPRVVSAETIGEALPTGTPQEAADRLVQLALRAGGPDNITVIVADVVDPTTVPPTTPMVVGAAGLLRDRPTAATGSAAARAAALTAPRPEATEPEPEELPDDRRPRWVRPALASIFVLALVATGLFSADRWVRTQYYVGQKDGNITRFQGLNTTLGPLHLSHADRETQLPVSSLSSTDQDRVRSGIPSDDGLDGAEQTIRSLAAVSSACRTPTPAATPSATASPSKTATSAKTAPAANSKQQPTAPAPKPSSTGAATVKPPTEPNPPRPTDCGTR